MFKLLAILTLAFPLTNCGLVQKATEKSRAKKQNEALLAHNKAQKEQLEKSIGVDTVADIVSVDLESQFVLLRNLKVPGLAADLNCHVKSGSQTKLRTCASMKAGFIVADIVSGTPRRGEAVVLSKDQSDKKPDAASKYMPAGMSEEAYWNAKRQEEIPALAPLQTPEGNPSIPDVGAAVLGVPKTGAP